MLGTRSGQRVLCEADQLCLELVGRDSFYGQLAALRGQLFRDEDFADLYGPDNGRTSWPPSLLATALWLQAYDKVSDAEARARAVFDLRWKVALGVDLEAQPFAQSRLQQFRAQLILLAKIGAVFQRSLELARESGLWPGRLLQLALDATPILGRGAVKDTYPLLADGMRQLMRRLAPRQETDLGLWAEQQGYARYLAPSLKGETPVVVARLLGHLLLQDVERPAEGVRPSRG